MKLLTLFLICAVPMIVHTTASAAEGNLPAKEASTGPGGCRIEKLTVPSPSMGRDIEVVVVLPPTYDANPDKTYPVLYALHGRGATYTVWSEMSPLRKAMKTQPMIVASFDCDRAGFYIDATEKPKSQFRTFFFDEFMPYVETAYRASGVRGVTGFSMGGYGALYYMVTKPDLFASISSLSGAMGILRGKDGAGQENIRALIGPYDQNQVEYDKITVAGRLTALVAESVRLPAIMLHCGTEDHLLKNNREFVTLLIAQNKIIRERLMPQVADETDRRIRRRKLSALLREHQIDFTYIESPGGHDWPFWRDASANVADFHWESFQRAKPVKLPAAKQGEQATD